MVGGRCQAITQVKQLIAGSVLGWVTACTRTNAIQYSIGENGDGHILMRGNSGSKEVTGDRGREKGKKVGDMYKAISYHTGGNTNKKIYITLIVPRFSKKLLFSNCDCFKGTFTF